MPASSKGRGYHESRPLLTGGVLRCSECGRAMCTNHILSRSAAACHRCSGHYQGGLALCPANRAIRAEGTEAEVWEFVRGILTAPRARPGVSRRGRRKEPGPATRRRKRKRRPG